MKTLVLTALVFFPAVTLTAASYNEPLSLESVSQTSGLDNWFADYDMYCKTLSDTRAPQKGNVNNLSLASKLDALLDENLVLTESLLSLKTQSKLESTAREKFFMQLQLERASLTVQLNGVENSIGGIASKEAFKPGPLMSRAMKIRGEALRTLASSDESVRR